LSSYGYVQVMDGIRSWLVRCDNPNPYVELLKELHEADQSGCLPWERPDRQSDIEALRGRIEKMENDLKTALWALGRVDAHEHLEDGSEGRVTGAGAPEGGWQARGFHESDGKFCARATCDQTHILKGEYLSE
jgi:hypothetical protein